MISRLLSILLGIAGLGLLVLGGAHICRNFHPFGPAGSEGFSLVLEGRWLAIAVLGALMCLLSWVLGRAS